MSGGVSDVCVTEGAGAARGMRRARSGTAAGAGAVAVTRGLSTAGDDAGRTLLTRLGIRKPSGLAPAARPRAARTFSLDDLLKPPPRRKDGSVEAGALRCTNASLHSLHTTSRAACNVITYANYICI